MSLPIKLGVIADDFTGAADLANNLVRGGMRVVQTIGIPPGPVSNNADAVVVALKTRTVQASEAVTQSLAALYWLKAQGAQQIYFKYCSTFDSTKDGNIGPVIDALMSALETDFTIACPAFPANGRTVYNGYLFVGEVLLHESGMRNHPLTPMTDSSLVRVLQSQTARRVGLIGHRRVAQGTEVIRQDIASLRSQGVAIAIVDATSDADLLTLAPALSSLPLVTAGSGVAIGLPSNFGITASPFAGELPRAEGKRAIVSGSCSTTTNSQVADFVSKDGAAFAIDPLELANNAELVAEALAWAKGPLSAGSPVLIYATASPEAVKSVQAKLGVAEGGELVEHALASIARGLVKQGVGQLIIAGGETSGACVQALDIDTLRIGPQIDPGVPWCYALSSHATSGGVHVALKSGNFGSTDFFTTAFDQLP